MATNTYFNNYKASNEQDLVESMIIESIQIKGLDLVYIERIQENMDYLFNEDTTNVFKQGTIIEMYPTFVTGFDGDGEMFTRFGLDNFKTGSFVVSKKRFEDEMPSFIRPKEGDILFMPITNSFLIIRFVNAESPFFEKGKQFVWELNTELMTYSHEDFTITDQEASDAFDAIDLDSILNSDGSEEIYTDDDPSADNRELEEDGEELIVVNPSNPFGVR